MSENEPFVPPVVTVRGRRVVLDVDCAVLYAVTPQHLQYKVLSEPRRFPDDFAMRLTPAEADRLAPRCGGVRPMWAFTPNGLSMLSHVLNSELAINGSVNMTRAFVHYDAMAVMGGGAN